MCIGGRQGASVDISKIGEATRMAKLYGESLSRIIVAVSPENLENFEQKIQEHHHIEFGKTNDSGELVILDEGKELVKLDIETATSVWKSTFSGGDF